MAEVLIIVLAANLLVTGFMIGAYRKLTTTFYSMTRVYANLLQSVRPREEHTPDEVLTVLAKDLEEV